MTKLRAPGEPGRYMPAMARVCGFDGGHNASPTCGAPATLHLFAGSPEAGPSDWMMFACNDHEVQAKKLAWDFHEVAPVCDVPGTMWHAESTQGHGFCYWPEAEAVIHESVAEARTLETSS